MSVETRKINGLPIFTGVNNDTYVLAEVGGAAKRIPAAKLIPGTEVLLDDLSAAWEWKAGYYKTQDGTLNPNTAGFWCSDSYISVVPGEKYIVVGYTYPGKPTATLATFGARGKFTDSSGNFVSGILYADIVGSDTRYEVVVPAGATQMYINVWFDSVADIELKVYKAPTNKIMGKKWVSLGDSITNRAQWQHHLYNKYGLAHTNCGIGSTCLAGPDDATLPPFWNANRLAEVKVADPDILTILGGANDLVKPNITMGDETQFELPLASKDKNTFIGAYSYIIETLLAWKPTLRIVILGTIWAHMDGKDYSDTYTYTDFSDACRKVAAYYGLPFVDLHGKCGFNKFTMEDAPYNIYSADHIHPNAEGGRIMAEVIDEVFSSLFMF